MSDTPNICIHCGLCCDGTLFNRAFIKENEQIATGYSFEILEDEKRAFKLPCAYLNEKVCSIYTERPYSICEAFQCKLLRTFRAGKITFDDALKVVNNTLALKEKIELQLLESDPENIADSFNRKIKNFNKQHTEARDKGAFRKKNGKTLLDIFIMNKILSKTFRNSPDKKNTE